MTRSVYDEDTLHKKYTLLSNFGHKSLRFSLFGDSQTRQFQALWHKTTPTLTPKIKALVIRAIPSYFRLLLTNVSSSTVL